MYRLARDHSNKMTKAKRLFHSGRYALQGGENISGGKGNHSPKDFVNSWMKSPEHRAWLLDSKVKTAAVGISKSRYGSYATWSFSDQPLPHQLHPLKGISGWLYKLFHITYNTFTYKGKPIIRPLPNKPSIISWLFQIITLGARLALIGLIILGIHGLWVYFSRIEVLFGSDTAKLFLAIQVPMRLQDIILWMSIKGLQSWFFPAIFIIAGIILWRWLIPTFQRKI